MKKVLVLFFAMLVILPSVAQKAKVRSARFKYIHYPKNPLPLWVKTYSVEVTNTSTRLKVGSDRISEYLTLQGFKEAETGTVADVKLVFELHGVQTSADIHTKEETKKEDDKEVKVTYYYHQVISKVAGKFTIIDKNGKEVSKDIFNGKDFENVSKSGLFKTRKEAQADYNKRKNGIISSSDNTALDNALSTFKGSMDKNFGYYMANDDAIVATGKGKKHDYSDLDAALEKFTEAANYYNSEDQEKYNELAKECIKIWETALEEFDLKNKKARISKKNADWLYLSMASAYLYMNEFDKAIECMNKGQEIDSGLQSKSILANIKDRKYCFQKNQEREQEKI